MGATTNMRIDITNEPRCRREAAQVLSSEGSLFHFYDQDWTLAQLLKAK